MEDEVDARFPSAEGRPCGDQEVDFYDTVLEFGFPHFHSYYEAVQEREKEPSLKEAEATLKLDKDTFPDSSVGGVGLDDIEDVFGDLFGG